MVFVFLKCCFYVVVVYSVKRGHLHTLMSSAKPLVDSYVQVGSDVGWVLQLEPT